MNRKIPSGYSLMEVIAVLAIAATLFALTVPAITSSLRASKLTTTGDSVMDELSLARQQAISRNIPIEVRFYKLPDHGKPVSEEPAVYRGMQLFQGTGAAAVPLDKVNWFPAPVVISPNGIGESPILTSAEQPSIDAPELPDYKHNYRYISFRFYPGGFADLDPSANHLTLVLTNDRPLKDGVNYYLIQVNPISGSVRAFRPGSQ